MPESFNTSSQSSSSTSTGSYIPDYIQSPFLMQVAGAANNIAQQLYNWGQQQYAHTSQITENSINQYLQNTAMATGLGANAIDRYTGRFQPLEDQLIRDANTYASAPRIAQQMGMAEAGQQQGAEAARQNALRDLRSYGIDPSSGRYAALDSINRTAAGAAAAGAGQQAQLNTEATGRQLRGQAIQVGQQYPATAMNALNTGLQGIAGAVNAGLSNANTGVNLMGLPDKYLGTAMGLKYPPLGTGPGSSQSQGSSQGRSSTPDRNQQQQPQNQGAGQGQGRGTGAGTGGPTYGGPRTVYAPQSGAAQYPVAPGAYSQTDGGDYSQYAPDSMFDPNYSPNAEYGFGTDQGYTPSQDWGNTTGAYNSDYGGIPNYNFGTDQGYTPSEDWSQSALPNMPDYSAPWDTSQFAPTSDSSSWAMPEAPSDYGASDYSGYEGDYSYAAGGRVNGGIPGPDATTGGQVPMQASPSNGARQDDVNANLNVEEFVVPRDVARWKGEEFFHKMIAQSREARVTAQQTVSGKPGQQQPGPARFSSQTMGLR